MNPTPPHHLQATARALAQARQEHRCIDASAHGVRDAAEAYQVQAAVAAHMGWFDQAPARHWKSGAPSRKAIPTHAPLPPEGVWASPADARGWPFHWRGIEAEITFRLGQPVSAEMAAAASHAQACGWCDAMAVSIEIVDFRWQQALDAPPWHKLADLQSHGALVLGPWQPMQVRDWRSQNVEVRIGMQTSRFTGTHPLQDPTWGLTRWLQHAAQQSGTVHAGTIVTTGTWCGLPMAQAGDHVWVGFDGIGDAEVQL